MSLASLRLLFHSQRRICVFVTQNSSLQNIPSIKYSTHHQTFKYDDLIIDIAREDQLKPKPDFATVKFGTTYSDHMLEIQWNETEGWYRPRISPLHMFQLHPGAKVLHYAQAVFEGMKAYRHPDGKVVLFRPEMNMKRMLETSRRACLPSFDTNELLKCIKKLVSIDKSWVPNRDLCSLYIRPNFVGDEKSLGVASSKSALLYVVMCPVGPYFKATIEPISLLADPKYVRAFPGGVGSYKMASNYAPTLYVQKIAQEQQLDQVLWLFGKEHYITEAGAMNVFIVISNKGETELVTPPLDGTILPGVVRQSVLDLGRKWKEITVSERAITMHEVTDALREGRLREMFVCGTALSVCPVKLIKFKEEKLNLPTMEQKDPLFARFSKTLSDIQYGRTESEWPVPVDSI